MRTDIKLRNRINVPETELRKQKYLIYNNGNLKRKTKNQ